MKELKKRLNSPSIKDVSIQGGVRGLQGPCDAACNQACYEYASVYCAIDCSLSEDYSRDWADNLYWGAAGKLASIMGQC